jgi:hypothetical protein
MDTERRSGWLHIGLVIIGLLMLGGLLAVLSDVKISLKGDSAPGVSPSTFVPAPTRTRQ